MSTVVTISISTGPFSPSRTVHRLQTLGSSDWRHAVTDCQGAFGRRPRPVYLGDGASRSRIVVVQGVGRIRARYLTPTVSLGVISLVASSCGYYRGQIEPRAAHEFAVHVATQRGRAKRIQHRHPPRAQPVAPLRERPCRRPRLPPRRCTDQAPYRDQGHPGGAHGRRNDPITSQCLVMRCPPVSPLFASWPWLLHTGCSLEALDMTVHERNH